MSMTDQFTTVGAALDLTQPIEELQAFVEETERLMMQIQLLHLRDGYTVCPKTWEIS